MGMSFLQLILWYFARLTFCCLNCFHFTKIIKYTIPCIIPYLTLSIYQIRVEQNSISIRNIIQTIPMVISSFLLIFLNRLSPEKRKILVQFMQNSKKIFLKYFLKNIGISQYLLFRITKIEKGIVFCDISVINFKTL